MLSLNFATGAIEIIAGGAPFAVVVKGLMKQWQAKVFEFHFDVGDLSCVSVCSFDLDVIDDLVHDNGNSVSLEGNWVDTIGEQQPH